MTDEPERMADPAILPLADRGVELWQQPGVDKANVIELHPGHVRLLRLTAGANMASCPRA